MEEIGFLLSLPAFNQYLFVPKFDQALWVTNNKTSFPHFIPNIASPTAPLFSYFLPLNPKRHTCPSHRPHVRFPRRRYKDSVFAPNGGQCPFISSRHKVLHEWSKEVDIAKQKVWAEHIPFCLRGKLLTAFWQAQGIPVPESLVPGP
jgi:hypothetical protein